MVLQNRLDFKDSQRLSQRPGAYFLFRVFAFKHPVSMYCSELYILCPICIVYCQYVLWTLFCVPYVQCTVSMYCELYIVYHMYSVLSVCTAVNYILSTICTVYCQYVLQWTIYCAPYQCTVSMYCELYIVCQYWVQAWYFYINLPSRNDDKCSV